MSIKNPLLEKYSAKLSSNSSVSGSLLKGGADSGKTTSFSGIGLNPKGPTLSSNSHLKRSLEKDDLLSSYKLKKSSILLSSSPKSPVSLSRPLFNKTSLLSSTNTSSSALIKNQSLSAHSKTTASQESKDGEKLENSSLICPEISSKKFSPFLDDHDLIQPRVSYSSFNTYFSTNSSDVKSLSPDEVAKQDIINLTASSLIYVPKLDNRTDTVRMKLIELANIVIRYDPEFILKTALFSRRVLNIRVTANFLMAYAAFKKECRRYIKKYYNDTVMLPSDWIDVAELYTTLGDKNLGFSALPVCLRKAMIKKFPSFDTYQIGKYNKNPKKGNKSLIEDDDEEGKLYEKHHFTLKQLIRKIHISNPTDIVMPILGKKYPETQEAFYRSRLSGFWDESRAGKRMKVPTPYTWETQLAAKGNNSATWKELILSRKLPYMAMLRNLRNIIKSGVPENIHRIVQKKLCSAEDVKRSKQFPFRFLSAYTILDSLMDENEGAGAMTDWATQSEQDKLLATYKSCLDEAVQHAAVNNVKPIKGAVLILFDCSESMDESWASKGVKRTMRETAGLLTLMCMFSSEHCDLVYYNSKGTIRGEKLETGGKILSYLSTFVTHSTAANDKLKDDEASYFTMEECWRELMAKERHYDTIIQISHVCSDDHYFRNLYREQVNKDVLITMINLKSKSTSVSDSDYSDMFRHRNDVQLYGFSDQMLQYISERGSGELLSNVESIDKKYNLLPLPKPMAKTYISPLAKQVKSKVIRIFVSSTFADMQQERRVLMNELFPIVDDIVRAKNFTIQEVDLRWGVTEEEGSDSNKVILRCLDEVSRCQYFLCIIGNRYGTRFANYPTSPKQNISWLQNEDPGLSMTEIEVHHALYYSDIPPGNCIFLFKKNRDSAEAGVKELVEKIECYNNTMSILKICDYESVDNDFGSVTLDALQYTVIDDLLSTTDDSESEEDIHKSYLKQQGCLFVGRDNLVSSLVKSIKKERMVLVTGPSGTGKSALVAKALSLFKEDDVINDFYHIIKLDSKSKDLENLLLRLNFHLSKVINEELEDHFEPISTLWRQIAKCETHLKILIDGCDEILHSHDLFSWLPENVPSNVKFIFTASQSGQWSTVLQKRYSFISVFNVSKLSATEKTQVSKEMLAAYGKKLEDKGFNSQLSMLLSKREANNPLYIDLCINQLRLNAVFENLTQCIQELPSTTEELYTKIFNTAVQEVEASKKLLAYLLCSPKGLSESDALSFLKVKPLTLSTMLYYLKLFINTNQDSGVMSLANQLARKVVEKNCVDKKISEIHYELAGKYEHILLAGSCHYESNRTDAYQSLLSHYTQAGESNNVKSYLSNVNRYGTCLAGSCHYESNRIDAYQCLLYHYTQAGAWNNVKFYLSNLNFVRQMIYLGLLSEILQIFGIDVGKLKGIDKASFKNNMETERMKQLQQFLINNKLILSKEPFLLQQSILLSSEYLSDIIEGDDDIAFNNHVGSFTSLTPTSKTTRCLVNEHYSSTPTCIATLDSCEALLVGFHDSKLQVINVSDSMILQTFRGHTGPVTCCDFLTPSRFVSAGSDGSMRLWGLLSTVCLATITPHIYPVQDISVNVISKCVISAGLDRRVTVWHNDVIFDTIEFKNPMNCVTFIENGKKFVAGSWGGEVYAYDLVNKVKITVRKSGQVHKSSIKKLCSGKTQFASMDITGTVSVWDQKTLDVLQSIKIGQVTTISFDLDDNLVYGLSNGIINISSGFNSVSSLDNIPDNGPVTSLLCEKGVLTVGYYNGTVSIVGYYGGTGVVPLTRHKGKVNASVTWNWAPGCDYNAASCSDDGTVHLYLLCSGEPEKTKELDLHIGKVLALCYNKGSLFAGGTDCAITAIKVDDMSFKEVKLFGHQAPVSTLLALQGTKLISGSHDGTVRLWSPISGRCLTTNSHAHSDWVTCSAAVNEAASSFVTGSNDNTVVLWKIDGNRMFISNKLLGHTSPVTCVSPHHDKSGESIKMVLAGGQDGSVVLWNKEGKVISSSKPGKMSVNACTFSDVNADEAYIGTTDVGVKVLNPTKLNILSTLSHHTSNLRGIKGMTGQRIASISADNTVQCWAWSLEVGNKTSRLNSVRDIRSRENNGKWTVGIIDKAGTLAQYTVTESEAILDFCKADMAEKSTAFAIKLPKRNENISVWVPDDRLNTKEVVSNSEYTVEIYYTINSYGSRVKKFRVLQQDATEVYMDVLFTDISTFQSCMDLTDDGILIFGTYIPGIFHAWNLKTKKRLPSLNPGKISFTDSKEMECISTAGTFYDGKLIVGYVSGFILVPGKRIQDKAFVKVFQRAVTALEATVDPRDKKLVIFAGSKDGVVKVLKHSGTELNVIGMYHTKGPVTALRLLRKAPSRTARHIVVGDKCGGVHFLRWIPPLGDGVV